MKTQISLSEMHIELKRTQFDLNHLKKHCSALSLSITAHYEFEVLQETLQQLCLYIENIVGFEATVYCVGYQQPIHFWGDAQFIEAQETDQSCTPFLLLFCDNELDETLVQQAIKSCERYAT